jgi:hypothetical protein
MNRRSKYNGIKKLHHRVCADGVLRKFRSGFELRWSEYLDFMVKHKKYETWCYEPPAFVFNEIRHGTTRYTPDFRVWLWQGNNVYYNYHEIKGYLIPKDITKFRRMKKYYPDTKIWLVMYRMPPGKNVKAWELINKARKYVERVIDGGAILKQACLIMPSGRMK